MPLPASKAGVYIPALTNYLESECLPCFDPDRANAISWNYAYDEHSPQMNPQGIVAITSLQSSGLQRNINLDYQPEIYRFVLRLLVSESSEDVLKQLLMDWGFAIRQMMLKVRSEGISGNFINASGQEVKLTNFLSGVQFVNQQIQPRINPERGGTGAVVSTYDWQDESVSQFGQFI